MNKKIYLVEVRNKKGISDAFGLDVMKNIRETGIIKVKDVATSDLYRFQGDISLDDIKRIAEDVLLDKVIQEYIIRVEDGSHFEKKEYGVVVDVFYKRGVTDTVAETVAVAVKDAGIKKDVRISTGKRYYIKGGLTKKEVELICEKVLANRLVQDYLIH